MPEPAERLRYEPPWPWIIVSVCGYLETRIPPHIWPDYVILAMSAFVAFGVVLHAVLWFGTWVWFSLVKGGTE